MQIEYIFFVFFSGHNGKYWSVDSEGNINADSDSNDESKRFYFQFIGQSKLLIRSQSGAYIKGEQNGIFRANVDISKATQWEY